MFEVSPGTIIVFSDIGCPWAHLAVYRLHATRARLGLEGEVTFEHRSFPLELFNDRPTPKLIVGAEIPVVGGLDPSAGWQMWQRPDAEWPVTTLPALEAVHAAKDQSLRASERLDRALRVAFFGQSRTISMRHEILAVARDCHGVDARALEEALDDGRARARVLADYDAARSSQVKGSPHLFFPDGTDLHNPGIEMSWAGPHGRSFPVVHKDDPAVYEDLVRRATNGGGGD